MDSSTDQFDDALYDATKPIACTIDSTDLPDRLAVLERLRSSSHSIERTSHGVVIRFGGSDDAVAADVRKFAIEEKQCCEFWGFDVIERPGLALRWDGPPETAELMERLVGYFEGREPIGSLIGLL